MKIMRSSVALILASAAVMACSGTKSTGAESTGSSADAIKTATIFHSTQAGGNASGSVSSFDPNTQSSFQLQFGAWENKSAQSRTASLSFYGWGFSTVQVCYDEMICMWDPNTWTCDWETIHYCYDQQMPYWVTGYGDIPTGDFRVGPHTAHLTTDLANDPGFTAMRCGVDQYWNVTCTPITTGTFDVTWRDNGQFSKDEQGTWSYTSNSPWGSFSQRSTGHVSETSADVSGTALGGVPDNWGGIIGQSQGTSVAKDLIQGTPSSGDGGLPPPPPPPGDGGGD